MPSPSRCSSANATRSLIRRVGTKIERRAVGLNSAPRACRRSLPTSRRWRPRPVRRWEPRPTSSISRRLPTSTIAAVGLKKVATRSSGRIVAESPMRCGFATAARRRPDRRAARASASSAIRACCWPSREFRRRSTVATLRNSARDFSAVSRMYSDSGVVTSTCGGLRSICCAFARRSCRRCAPPSGSAQARSRARAARDLQLAQRKLQVFADVVGQRLERRDVDDQRLLGQRAADGACGPNRRDTIKNAARVLPEPVGAEMSTSPPARMSGQPRICGSVGRRKALGEPLAGPADGKNRSFHS